MTSGLLVVTFCILVYTILCNGWLIKRYHKTCKERAKALHARNTFQILGPTLNKPSSFLICWAQVDRHGSIKGGTATAWNLAKAHGVPCFNLYNEDDKQRLIKFVEG